MPLPHHAVWHLLLQVWASFSLTVSKLKKGPSVKAAFDDAGNLTRAGQGFLQGLNATGRNLSVKDLGRIADKKKGEYIAYDLTIKGEKITDLMPNILQKSA